MKGKRILGVIGMLCLVGGLLFSAGGSEAQTATKAINWPTKPIQLIVPYNPGGDTDIFGRVVAQAVQEVLGKPVVVVNVAGAGGTVASRQVRDADPDGYSILWMQPNLLLNKITGIADFSFEAFDGIATSISTKTTVLVTSGNSRFMNLNDLKKELVANPGTVKFATQVGGYTHLTALALENAAGSKFKKLDVGGNTDQVAALLGGHVDVMTMEYGIGKDYIESGKVRVLANLANTRSSVIPDVPTAKEQGLDLGVGFEKVFFTLFPKGTPTEIVEIFNNAVDEGIQSEKAKSDLMKFYATPDYRNAEDSYAFLESQMNYYMSMQDLLKNDTF
ncbi:MAG: tripartite tricarboxylate transporter substrate binding protein [Sphaerochaetaceae bacterium]